MTESRPDERFAHIANDRRFRTIPKRENKVKIDKRFTSMFHDKNFKLKYSMDKRGLPMHHSTSDDLKKFYNVSSEEEEEDDEKDPFKNVSKPLKEISNKDEINNDSSSSYDSQSANEKLASSSSSEEDQDDYFSEDDENKASSLEDDENESSSEEDETTKNGTELDLARGEGNIETSSSEDESDDEIDAEEKDGLLYHKWGEQDSEVIKNEETSKRLAICNMDWDRIKAHDLFVLFTSFKPPDGVVHSVQIYPSEYGLQRLKDENERGPSELVEEKLKSDDEDYAETEEGSKYHMEKLRKYQMNRLRYYYAVVNCDTAETASKLYTELEGMEFESSAAQLDLRFIPDQMIFEQEPKSVCESLPDMSVYEPNIFTTTALQQAKVDLTWDETDQDRVRLLEKAFVKVEDGENDLQAYLATSSSEDEVELEHVVTENNKEKIVKSVKEPAQRKTVKNQISKYKELLADLEQEEKNKEDDFEMEIKWEPGLKTKAEKGIKDNRKKKDLTVFEEYLSKKKDKKNEKRKSKYEEKDNDVEEEEEEEDERAFSDDELPEGVDLNDPFFQSLEDSKKQNEKKEKRTKKGVDRGETEESLKSKAELELLMMGEVNETKHFKLQDLIEETNVSKTKKRKLKRMQKDAKNNKKQNVNGNDVNEDNFQLNVSDTRFSALFSSSLYNIDPSDPHFKRTKGTESIVIEKQKRRENDSSSLKGQLPVKVSGEGEEVNLKERRPINSSLSLLVQSVKNKTKNFKKQ